jgi:conjugative relaxase-like TrwC/TraI family protein
MRPLNISPSQAKDYYYEVDPFFPPNKESEKTAGYYQSMWHGRVSSMMGIEHKEIQKTDFVNIISGNDLNGTKIIQDGKDNDGNSHHRAAIDIPFSAPKSVSLCALHVGDQDLIQAHTKAVEETVKYIENNYLYIRFTTDKTRPVQNPNGLFATFNHSTSRSNDPQLHTHTLVMNMSFPDHVNGWRATWNDKIFDDQKHLTMVYQNALAKNVKDLGYEVEKRPNGFWEIAGVKQEWIDIFSKRKKDIDEKEDELKQKVFSGNDSVLRNIAVLETRADKNPFISKEELKTLWEAQISKETIKENVEKIKTENREKTRLTPEEYLRLAYKTINENESTFRKYDVIDTAISLSIGDYSQEQFESKYNEMVRKNEIIKIAESVNSRGLVSEVYTSHFILETEQEIIKQFVDGLNNSPAIHNKQSVEDHIANTFSHFTNGQKNALIQSLTTRDQFMVIQGDAGTGKTSLMKAIKEIIDKDQINFEVKGLGFTGKAADELEKKSGIESQTITGFLHKKEGEGAQQNTLYIVDESSMVGNVQMLDLIDRAKNAGAKVIFVGDGKQLQAISAGKTFKVISESFKAELMEEAIRQKTEYMIDTVRHIKNYQTGKDLDGIEKAFDTLQMNGRVFEIKDQGKRINHVIKDYLSDNDYTRNIIVTLKNDDRKKINSHMVQVIAKESNKSRNIVETEIRLPVSLIGEARLHANSYTVGHKAFINGYGVNACIEAGTILENVRADQDKITANYKGQTYDLDFKNTSKDISVFQKLAPLSIETPHEFKPHDHYFIQSETIRGVFEVVKVGNEGVTFSQNKKEVYLTRDLINKTDIFKRSGKIHDVALGDLDRCVCVAEQNIDTGDSLKIGQEMTITGKNTITNTLDVEHKGKTFTIDLNENGHMLSVYEAEKRIFAEGEKVVLLKNDTKQEIQNGLTGVIERIDKFRNIKAVNDDRDIYFNVNTYPYVDHGYAVTFHKSQGQDARKVYIVSGTEYKGLNNTEVFNVGITRGQVDAFLYVDNAAIFKEQVKGEQGKTSTLDHIKIDLSKSNTSKDEGKGIE